MQIEVLIGIIAISGLIYWTNRSQTHQEASIGVLLGLHGLALFTGWIGISLLLVGLSGNSDADVATNLPDVPMSTAVLVAVLAALASFVSLVLINSSKQRHFIKRKCLNPIAPNNQYNPDSLVHTLAVTLALFVTVNTIANFVLSGGISGLAEDIEAAAPDAYALLTNLFVYVIVTMLGVGLFIRRNIPQVLARLGLGRPQWQDVTWGIGMGLFLFFLQVTLVLVWGTIASDEVVQQQSIASEQIFATFSGTFLGGLLLALSSSVGEELLFRGALQPIFGIFWTSVFFVVMHAQYTFTVASIILFIITLGFAWIRQRRNTTAAIFAHFTYNFIPFLLVWTTGA